MAERLSHHFDIAYHVQASAIEAVRTLALWLWRFKMWLFLSLVISKLFIVGSVIGRLSIYNEVPDRDVHRHETTAQTIDSSSC
jgi:hypothetical protein